MTSTAPKPSSQRNRILTIVIGVVAVLALVAVIIVVCNGEGSPSAAAAVKPKPAAAHEHAPARQAPVPTGPLSVTAITPAGGTNGVATNAVVTVDFSQPVSASSPTPTLSPAVAGTWSRNGSAMTFDPAGGYVPFSTETVTVPAGVTAASGGATLARATSSSFQIQAGSQTRLEQLLAQLGYLPFTFEPSGQAPDNVTAAGQHQAAMTSTAVSTSALPGTLVWSWPTVPSTLRALWTPGVANVMDQGAIMAFQSDHNMTMDGHAGPQLWSAVIAAANANQTATHPYDYLVASETVPETLKVYRDGQVIYTTLSNTGVPGATTQQGTFPVYLRYKTTTMSGTNVDGSKYVDPGIPWVAYFNGGDAVHGFVRGRYGFPQSNGCVELPISNAANVWTMDPYGTLVTVTA